MNSCVIGECPEPHPCDHENEATGYLSGWKLIQQLSDSVVKFKLNVGVTAHITRCPSHEMGPHLK
jgi:hypothetical protein